MIIRELAARLGLHLDADAFTAADKALTVVKGGYLAIGAAAGAAALAMAGAIAETARYADQVSKAAEKTGIGVESLQALQYAAERADVGLGGLQAAFRFMARKGVKDFEAEFRRAADELTRMPDGAAKAARAIALFGRTGESLIPMLNKGSAGLEEMKQKAQEMGIILSDELIEEGTATWDVLEELHGALRGIGRTIAGPLLKPAREFLRHLYQWLIANRQFVAQRMEQVFLAVAKSLEIVWKLAEPVLSILGSIFDFISEHQTIAMAAGGALAVIFAPALAAGAALLMIIEEIWGWITGRRKTLLEDMLGPFNQPEKQWKGLKWLSSELNIIRLTIEAVVAALRTMRELLSFSRAAGKVLNSGGVHTSASEAIGTPLLLRGLLGPGVGDWLASYWLKNKMGHVEQGLQAEQALRTQVEMNPAGPWSPSLIAKFGDVTVHAAPGVDGKQVGYDVMAAMQESMDAWWNGKVQEAAPMVTR